MPGDAGSPTYLYTDLRDQFFKAYSTWSLSHKVRSCSAVHAAVGFVLQISFVELALALLGDISSHDYNFCQLILSFAYITKVDVNMHSHSCLSVLQHQLC